MPNRSKAAFTLVELMVVVTILGILATIGVPMFKGYIYRSKASEATGFLLEIKNRQESYRSVYHQYINVSDSATDWHPSSDPGSSEQVWTSHANWNMLGAQPPGRRTYFSYVTIAGPPGTTPADRGAGSTLGYTGADFWFVSRALGDLDGDDENITFESYSESQTIWSSHTAGWE